MFSDIPGHVASLMGLTEPECPALSVYVALDSIEPSFGELLGSRLRTTLPAPQVSASMLQTQVLLA